MPEPPLAPPVPTPAATRRRVALFVAVCLLSLIGAGGYTALALQRQGATRVPAVPAADTVVTAPVRLLVVEAARYPVVDVGSLAQISFGEQEVAREPAPQRCQRVSMAAGRGLCLTLGHDLTTGSAFIFDEAFRLVRRVPAVGLPSRARVSADGRFGAMTFFVAGHGYDDTSFATQTALIDMTSGEVLANLEDWPVWRDGQRIQSPDFNFWGVTFAADGNQFYATLATGGVPYLVRGDIGARRLEVLRAGVECPSLSPDGARIVFKQRIGSDSPAVWRLTLLDLRTMTETPLPETRTVDDQAEWLDNTTVLYTPVTPRPEVWAMPVDGSGPPRLLLSGAVSPAVLR